MNDICCNNSACNPLGACRYTIHSGKRPENADKKIKNHSRNYVWKGAKPLNNTRESEIWTALLNLGYITETGEIYNLQAVLHYIYGCGYTEHHTAFKSGYLSRKKKGYVSAYVGRFGRGFILERPTDSGTLYHPITYYTEIVSNQD